MMVGRVDYAAQVEAEDWVHGEMIVVKAWVLGMEKFGQGVLDDLDLTRHSIDEYGGVVRTVG